VIPEPEDAARWCADVAAVLFAASDRTARLAVGIAEDWLDDRGREWAERVALLRRELDRSAEDAAEQGRRLADSGTAPLIAPTGPARGGPRLGGVGGIRTEDDTGMRIAELPPA
jgi:hypothetical protein